MLQSFNVERKHKTRETWSVVGGSP